MNIIELINKQNCLLHGEVDDISRLGKSRVENGSGIDRKSTYKSLCHGRRRISMVDVTANR